MTTKEKEAFVVIAFWAVGSAPNTSQIAIQLNDGAPFLMSAADARAISKALLSEAESVTQPKLDILPIRERSLLRGTKAVSRSKRELRKAAR